MPLLEGVDGFEKMSKSLGNYIGVIESPYEMYGKLMSIPDKLIFKYFRLLTSLSEKEIDLKEREFNRGKLHPRELKGELAEKVVTFYYGELAAKVASERFEAIFKKKEIPEEIPSYFLPLDQMRKDRIWIVKLLQLTGLAESRSQARRLIEQGGVKWDGEKVKDVDWDVSLDKSHILQVGKRKFIRIARKS